MEIFKTRNERTIFPLICSVFYKQTLYKTSTLTLTSVLYSCIALLLFSLMLHRHCPAERLGQVDMSVKMQIICTYTERPYEALLFPAIRFEPFLCSSGGGQRMRKNSNVVLEITGQGKASSRQFLSCPKPKTILISKSEVRPH